MSKPKDERMQPLTTIETKRNMARHQLNNQTYVDEKKFQETLQLLQQLEGSRGPKRRCEEDETTNAYTSIMHTSSDPWTSEDPDNPTYVRLRGRKSKDMQLTHMRGNNVMKLENLKIYLGLCDQAQ